MEVHFVVPEGIDDPARPSGGNAYDRHVGTELAAAGWSLAMHSGALEGVMAAVPDDAVVMVDGLIASAAPEVLVPQAGRLRLVVLMHMPLQTEPERAVLHASRAVITTSGWCRRTLLELHGLAPRRVHVAEPGVVAPARLAPGSGGGGELLCVAAVIPGKGHDLLVDALAGVPGPWRCTCVGSLERDPAFVERLRARVRALGLEDRVAFTGALGGPALARRYAGSDVLVLASRAETYGMVVTEALAAGLPVIATEVGGVPEALGRDSRRTRPGLLVAPGDPAELAGALRPWLGDAGLRRTLRQAACDRRSALSGWPETAAAISTVLAEAAR